MDIFGYVREQIVNAGFVKMMMLLYVNLNKRLSIDINVVRGSSASMGVTVLFMEQLLKV